MVLEVLYFNHDAALGLDSEGWCLHLHAALNEAWCRFLSFETRLGSFGGTIQISSCITKHWTITRVREFFCRDLLVVRGPLPSIGNMWVLGLVVGYLYTCRCWCGCGLLTADIRYVLYAYLGWGSFPSVAVVIVSCRPYSMGRDAG